MHNKTLLLAIFVLAGLTLASTGGLMAGAWHVPEGGIVTNISSTSVMAGQNVSDTAIVTGTGCGSQGHSSCGNLYGTVVFQVYAGNDCSGTPLAWSHGVYSNSVTIKSPGTSNPGVFKSANFSTVGLATGNYSFQAKYVSGNYYTGSLNDIGPCEPFSIVPSTGVPEFGLAGILGLSLVFAMAVPLLLVARKFRPIRLP